MRIAVSGGGTGGHIYPAWPLLKKFSAGIRMWNFCISEQRTVLRKKLLNGKISRFVPLKLQVSNENFLLKM